MKITVSSSFEKKLLVFLCPLSSPESSVVACFWCFFTSTEGERWEQCADKQIHTHTQTHTFSISHIQYIVSRHIPKTCKNMNTNNVCVSLRVNCLLALQLLKVKHCKCCHCIALLHQLTQPEIMVMLANEALTNPFCMCTVIPLIN